MRSLFVKKYTLSFCIAQKSLLCKRFLLTVKMIIYVIQIVIYHEVISSKHSQN